MLSTIQQVRDWIKDNGFKRWVLYRDYGRTEKILDSAGLAVADLPDKIAMTEKYLRLAGGHAYAAGATTNAANDLVTVCEIQLAEPAAQTAGVGSQPTIDEDKIAARIEAKIRAEYERKEYERLRKELDDDRKRFEDEKASAMGALAHYFAPVGQALLGGQRRMVAGVDAERPVHVAPIIPDGGEQEHAQEQEEDIFTDEESDKLFALMARFKKIEPDNFLKLIERMVEMAESGDGTYTMAKGFLLK